MCCESSDVVRFDLGPLLQGQTRIAKLKSANIQIQICIGSPICRSSFKMDFDDIFRIC